MLLDQVKIFLSQLPHEDVPEEVFEQFGEECKNALRRMVSRPEEEFSIRMSSVGRPLCQQQMEASGAEREPGEYNIPMKFLLGDLIEAAAMAIMKAAGVNIQSEQEVVSLDIGGTTIKGTLDAVVDGKLYDIKSCSPYAFSSKFGSATGWQKLQEDDPFGYVNQGYLYAEAKQLPFGGWIAINKATGEWAVLEPPIADRSYRKAALLNAAANIEVIRTQAPFERKFELIDETFYQKPTGKKVLPKTCEFCKFKHSCWAPGTVTKLPQEKSKAKFPKQFYYYQEEVDGPGN